METGTFQQSMRPEMVTDQGVSNNLQFGIDALAIIIGVFAVVMALRLTRKLGGRINQALHYFILGVVCNAAAIGWSLFFGHMYVIAGANFDVHQNLMTIGMIFFIISTFKFSRLMQNV